MNEPIFIARQDTLEQEILPAHWLAQYKLFGEESYTFQDKEIWKKLCMSSAAANDRDMHAVAASSTAMTAVAASGVALKAIAQAYKKTANMLQFLKAVNASDTLVKRIYSTLTNATALFGAAQLGSQDSVENANSWATTSAAPNAFLACACGYYGSSSDSVSVTYNGTVIAQKKTGTKQPGSVASTNVNAITMAPSTFTENGDGYLAVQKFTAK